jgi:putative FmdB family regulatory protein
MPIYEYGCQKCGKRTETIQQIGEKLLKICPHCGGRRLKKLASAPAIQFRGSGWYVTDYAGGDRAERTKAASSEKTDKSEKTEKAEKTEKTEKTEKSAEKPAEKKKEHKEKKAKE